ncbi:hypothetical protein D9M68_758760 [compost metagenome]
MTTEAQSVSGMKPMRTSAFSGASEPAAHAPARTSGSTSVITLAPAMVASARRRPLLAGTASAAAAEAASEAFTAACSGLAILRREGIAKLQEKSVPVRGRLRQKPVRCRDAVVHGVAQPALAVSA